MEPDPNESITMYTLYAELCRLTTAVERLESAQRDIATVIQTVKDKGGMAAKMLGLT